MSSVPKNLTRERLLALIACLLITFCMGTIHSFSTLIQNLEIQTSVGRMASSFVYSVALVNVTLAVFFGYILYRKLSPNVLISLIYSFRIKKPPLYFSTKDIRVFKVQ